VKHVPLGKQDDTPMQLYAEVVLIPETMMKLCKAVKTFEGKPELEIAKTKGCVHDGCDKKGLN